MEVNDILYAVHEDICVNNAITRIGRAGARVGSKWRDHIQRCVLHTKLCHRWRLLLRYRKRRRQHQNGYAQQ